MLDHRKAFGSYDHKNDIHIRYVFSFFLYFVYRPSLLGANRLIDPFIYVNLITIVLGVTLAQ